MPESMLIQFFGGPADGKDISIEIHPLMDSAPEWIKYPVENEPDPHGRVQLGPAEWTVHVYRCPAGDEELAAAQRAVEEGTPVRYVYAGTEAMKR